MLTPKKHRTDAFPDKQDVIHFVIALEDGEFEQPGETLEGQLAAYKAKIRESLQSLGVGTWMAGIHLNTGIPHAHVTITRQQ